MRPLSLGPHAERPLRRGAIRRPDRSKALWTLLVVACAAFSWQPRCLHAEDTPSDKQRAISTVRLRLPLKGSDDQLYLGRLQRAVDSLTSGQTTEGVGRPLLVLEFDSEQDAAPTEFERSLRLARFLVGDDLAAVKTIAYLPSSIEGHAVLIAMACEEIAMAPEAEIGRAGDADATGRPLEPSVRAAYQQIAEARLTAPPAVVTAMVDPQAELLRVETERGIDFVLRKELEALREEQSIASEESLSPPGTLAVFTGRQGREQGFVKYLVADRAALARSLGVAADRLQEDQSLTTDWRPVMIDLEGPLTNRVVRRTETLIGDEIDRRSVNWIGVRIDSRSGDWQSALQLARTLAELGDSEVRTIAYVPRQAEGPAALVALACDQLVMHADATLGGANDSEQDEALGVALLRDDPDPAEAEGEGEGEEDQDEAEQPGRRLGGGDDPPAEDEEALEEIDDVVATLRESLAEESERTWSLFASAVDPRVELSRYANRQTGEQRLLIAEELESLPDRADWRRGEKIKPAGEPLKLDGAQAEANGVAWQAVDQFDDLHTLYGFDEPPRTAKPNWALELVEALASPGFAAMLLVIGVVGIYIELSSPGLGVGGFISAVAFLLFFWSKFLDGTADWLEVLLFVSGVVFLLIELVVLPGFGIFGLGGGLLMLVALVLASQTFVLPKTETQLVELRNSLAVVTGAGVLCMGVAFALRQYLLQSPFFRRAMLMPPEEADRIEQSRREQLADYDHLLGGTGEATTDLLPAGRAEIDGELVDVITDGEVIDRGAAIEVVRTQASRVVVRQVRG